jgi:hypothetical protein
MSASSKKSKDTVVNVEVRICHFFNLLTKPSLNTFHNTHHFYFRMMMRRRKKSLLSERGSCKILRPQLEAKEGPLLRRIRLNQP